MTYKVPKPRGKPFRKGDLVETCDRHLEVMEVVRIVAAGSRQVRTECGRLWRQKDGWWIGDTGVFPFPSIRHLKKEHKP